MFRSDFFKAEQTKQEHSNLPRICPRACAVSSYHDSVKTRSGARLNQDFDQAMAITAGLGYKENEEERNAHFCRICK